MPAINLAKLPTLPYVYSTTTPGTINTCQLVTVPNASGLLMTLHNRDKASKILRISFDPALTQGGAAPSTWYTVDTDTPITLDGGGLVGATTATQLAIFSPDLSVNCELIFTAKR